MKYQKYNKYKQNQVLSIEIYHTISQLIEAINWRKSSRLNSNMPNIESKSLKVKVKRQSEGKREIINLEGFSPEEGER